MSNDIHDNAALYSLNALPPTEVAAFEEHLQTCATCQSEVAALQVTTLELTSVAAVEPPRELRRSVLAAIANAPQEQASVAESAEVIDLIQYRTRQVLAAVAASAVAAAIAVLILIGTGVFSETSTFDEIASQSDAEQLVLFGDGPGEVSLAWSCESLAFAVVAEMLPVLADDEAYQLWIIDEGNMLVSAGMLTPDESGNVEIEGTLVANPSTFAVTIEPTGGSPTPLGPFIFEAS